MSAKDTLGNRKKIITTVWETERALNNKQPQQQQNNTNHQTSSNQNNSCIEMPKNKKQKLYNR